MIRTPSTFLSLARKAEGAWHHAMAAGLFLTLAGMLRYEAWMLIPLFALVLWGKWQFAAIFTAASMIFPTVWMAASTKSTARGASDRASKRPRRICAMHAICNSSRASNTGTYGVSLAIAAWKLPDSALAVASHRRRISAGTGRGSAENRFAVAVADEANEAPALTS